MLRAVLGFGDAVGRYRVSEQELGNAARAERGLAPHRFEERGHAIGVVASGGQHAHADSVCFRFVRAGVVQSLLGRHALRDRYRALYRIAAATGSDANEDGRQHAEGGHGGVFGLRRQTARQVALGDMGNFVRQYAREFALVGRGRDETRVYANEPARQRKRVQVRVLHDEEVELQVAFVRLDGQALAQLLDVVR